MLITLLNLFGVSEFGEFEFWFALIKIVAVIAMIAGGLWVIVANLPTDSGVRASFANWFTVDGGFFPHGAMSRAADGHWDGLLMALVVVMFSFGGTELIGVTAGEVENPSKTIPRATNGIIWRILVFYVAALGIIMAVVPWDRIDGKMSPFVQIFDSVGVPVAAGILNFVCLTAVMSVYNSALYSNSRMLFSLARQGNAPAYLGRVNKRGVPVAGVLTSAAVTVVAVVVVFLWPQFAFNYLMSIATIAAIINWTMIMITEMLFRRRVAAGDGGRAQRIARCRGAREDSVQAAGVELDAVCDYRVPRHGGRAHVLLAELPHCAHRRCDLARRVVRRVCDHLARLGEARREDRARLHAQVGVAVGRCVVGFADASVWHAVFRLLRGRFCGCFRKLCCFQTIPWRVSRIPPRGMPFWSLLAVRFSDASVRCAAGKTACGLVLGCFREMCL